MAAHARKAYVLQLAERSAVARRQTESSILDHLIARQGKRAFDQVIAGCEPMLRWATMPIHVIPCLGCGCVDRILDLLQGGRARVADTGRARRDGADAWSGEYERWSAWSWARSPPPLPPVACSAAGQPMSGNCRHRQ